MKILFTDLDETLLNKESRVSDYTKDVLDRFCSAGNRFVIASGRSMDSVKEVREKAGLFYPGMFLVAYNGSQIYNCDLDKNILEYRLPFSTVDYVEQKAKEAGIHIQTYTAHNIVVHEEDEEVKFYRRRIHQEMICTDHFTSVLTEEPFKLLGIDLYDHERIAAFGASFDEWGKEHGMQTLFSNPRYLEFFDVRSGKGNAVRYLCEHLGIPLENSYAAGDAENDLSMIQAAGNGIAMINGEEMVKKAADIITEYDNDHDGLARFIETIM